MSEKSANRVYYEAWAYGRTPEGEEYKTSLDVWDATSAIELTRYLVLRTENGERPQVIGLYDSMEAASGAAEGAEDTDAEVHIKSQTILTSVEEMAANIRERLLGLSDGGDRDEKGERESRRARQGGANVFRKAISEGIIERDGRYQWLCSCGATGQESHKTEHGRYE